MIFVSPLGGKKACFNALALTFGALFILPQPMRKVDVCIVGAGPAGATLSHFLHKLKIEHLMLDQARFPRDKICGDGITVDVLNVLKRIDPALLERFDAQSEMLPSWGFCFRGPQGRELRYDFKEAGFPYAPFYTSRRQDLDQFLVEQLPEGGSGEFWPETKVVDINREAEGLRVTYEKGAEKGEVLAKVVVGAEGEKPVVTRFLGLEHFREKPNLIAALRVYYENVQGFHPNNHLEFFFDSKLLPGYFWAFPLSENQANVGLGMVSTAIAAKKINLKKILAEIVVQNPVIAPYFAEAKPLEKPQGWGLPIITPKRKIAGPGYALIGDAGGMIEAFTGKGIGPGMMSARILSEHLERAFRAKNFDLFPYHEHMYRYYKSEIRASYALQRSLKYPPALNAVIGVSNLAPFKRWSHQKMVTEWSRWI